jgi:hypothetical protein
MIGAHGRDVHDTETGRRRCTANRRGTDVRCLKRPAPGATVCRNHGAAAPQTKKAARRRLLEAVDPAVTILVEIVEGPTAEWQCLERGTESRASVWKLVGYAPETQRGAANDILDRTGYHRTTGVELSDTATEILEERILAELEELGIDPVE